MIDSPDYLTTGALHYLEGRSNYRLLFGHPANLVTEDHRYGESHDIAYFRPGSIFAVDLWDRNEYGTMRWRVYILKAGAVCWCRRDFDPGRRFWLPHLRPLESSRKQSFAMHTGGSMNSGGLGQNRVGVNTQSYKSSTLPGFGDLTSQPIDRPKPDIPAPLKIECGCLKMVSINFTCWIPDTATKAACLPAQPALM